MFCILYPLGHFGLTPVTNFLVVPLMHVIVNFPVAGVGATGVGATGVGA